MPRCHWLQHSPAIFGVIILVALFLAPLIDHKREADRAYEASQQEYAESKRILPPGRAVTNGKDTDHKSYRDEWRSEQDLQAQREMAATSLWAAVATWLGVFFLAATLWETAKAAKAAAEAATAAREALGAERAWMTLEGFDGVTSSPITIGGVRYERGYAVTLRWQNTGRSPAVAVNVSIDHRIIDTRQDVPFFEPPPPPDGTQGVVGPACPARTLQKAIDWETFERLKRREIRWIVFSRATYRTVFDNEASAHRQSDLCGELVYQGERPNGDDVIPVVTLTVVGPQNNAT